MVRFRTAGVLVAAMALLAAACGEEVVTSTDPQTGAEASSITQAAPDDSSAASAPATDDSGASEADEPSDAGDATGADSEGDDAASSEDRQDGVPADAESLLASVTTQLDGRSVRGEATIDVGPGFQLLTNFESDADGDFAAAVELPPGVDPEFPGGADSEVRYVGGVVYVRPAVSAETLAELGLAEAWYIFEPVAGGDPMNDVVGSAGGVMCLFPQMLDAALADCDPLGGTATFLEAASEAEVVGREDVRGVEATRVRFLVSLRDLAGEALGEMPNESDAEPSEGGAFDDSASDPFAEGLEQIFGFLDASFEVEVWIDDHHLIRRLAFDLASLFAGIAGPEVEMPSNVVTLEFYDFDADISVDAPPAEVIVDDPGLILGDDDIAFEEIELDDYSDDDYGG